MFDQYGEFIKDNPSLSPDDAIDPSRIILETQDLTRHYTQSDEVITAVNRVNLKVHEAISLPSSVRPDRARAPCSICLPGLTAPTRDRSLSAGRTSPP